MNTIEREKRLKGIIENYIDGTFNQKYFMLKEISTNKLVKVSDKVAQSLFILAVNKYKDIDFGSLDDSKGDFTKFNQYHTIKASVELLKQLAGDESLPAQHPIMTLSDALDNITDNSANFTKGFREKIGSVKMMYNLVARAIIEYAGVLISTSVDLVKRKEGTYKAVFKERATKDRGMYILKEALDGFNDMCASGESDKFFKTTNSKNFVGTVVTIGMTAVVMFLSVMGAVMIVRQLVYYFYNSRVRLSEYLEAQALLLELNTLDLDDPKVVERQEKLAKRLHTLADKIAINSTTKGKSTDSELKKDEDQAKVSVDDIGDMSDEPIII